MQIEMVPLSNLKPYPGNPRINDDAVEGVVKSIREFGFRQPIVVDGEWVIVCGHTRFKAAKQLGLKAVPVHVVRDLTAEQLRAYRLADNRSAEKSKWDYDLLPLELEGLKASNYDLSLIGFTLEDLTQICGPDEPREGLSDPDEIPEPPIDPITCEGDLWQLGEHRLLCGDSTKEVDVLRLLGSQKARLMVTDPPYGVSYEGGVNSLKKRELLKGDNSTEIFKLFISPARLAVPSGAWYIWHAGSKAESAYEAIREADFEVRSLVIWHKLKAHYGSPNSHYCQKHEPCLYAVRGNAHFIGPTNEVTVWEIEQPRRNEFHPTQKPVECMLRAIRNHDAPLIYDPFLGSGTTLIAAEHLRRKCFGLEINPEYCDVVVKRWEAFTGQKAERISLGEVSV